MLRDILIFSKNRKDDYYYDKLELNILFCHFVSGLASQPLGSFIPFLREAYGFDYDLSGILLSCQSIGNLMATMLAGILPYYLGRRKNVLLFSVWMAVAYFIFASGVGSPLILVLAFFMTGIARGTNSNFNITMMSSLPGEKAAQGYNLLHGAFAIGAFISPLVLIVITSKVPIYGWKIVALIIAIICVVQFVKYRTIDIIELPKKKGVENIDTKFLKNPDFWFASSMIFCYICTEYAIVGWLVTYFKDTGILSANMAQMMNSLFWIVMLTGRLIGASLTGKISTDKILLIDGIGLVVFFLMLFVSRTVINVVIGLIGTSFFMATIYPEAYAYGGDTVKGNDFANSMMIFTGAIGGIVTPMIVGFIAENAGIVAGMKTIIVLTFMMLVSIIISFVRTRIKKTSNNKFVINMLKK